MEERIVIVAYRPKAGKAEALRELVRSHYPTLQQLGLVTDRLPIIMEAKDGTIIEVFGWKSKAAIEQAHTNPTILQMWDQYAQVCDYVPIVKVEETANLFAEFMPFG